MKESKNRRVYKRHNDGRLEFITTVMSDGPAEAAEGAALRAGKYVVTDMDFTEVSQVYVTLSAKVV